MLSDPFHKIDTSVLYPIFLAKLQQLVANCAARGHVFFATSGGRGEVEQAALYAQGRTRPGPIVTNAKFGQSAHSFFIGCDFTHDLGDDASNGLTPDWTPEQYRVLAEEAEKLGLEAGFNWAGFPDRPHIQLRLSKHGILLFPNPKLPDAPDLLTFYHKGGMETVFAYLDLFEW